LATAAIALCALPARAAEPVLEKTDLFTAGQGGYVMCRIPGVCVSKRGTLLVYCEGRQGSGDWTQQDILLRRSTDGGKTWSDPKVLSKRPPNLQPNPAGLKQGLTKADKVTAHNAICIADAETGAVHMLYGIEYSRFFHIVSTDEGDTWSEPAEVTEALTAYRKDYAWIVVGNGCGHGIQLTQGAHAGRMLAAFWFSLGTGGHAHRPSDLGVLFSDDHGKTWQTGGFISRNGEASADGRKIVNPNETMLVELSDGRVMANIRSESEANRRLLALSADGGATWEKPAFHDDLSEPICMASMIRLADGGILFSNPDNLLAGGKPGKPGQNRDRRNVTIRLTRDDGKTWPVKRPIEEGFSGYSDLGVLPDGTLLCFYERGAAKGNHYSTEALTLARFNLEWLSAERKPQP
jgi:sialidase-1